MEITQRQNVECRAELQQAELTLHRVWEHECFLRNEGFPLVAACLALARQELMITFFSQKLMNKN